MQKTRARRAVNKNVIKFAFLDLIRFFVFCQSWLLEGYCSQCPLAMTMVFTRVYVILRDHSFLGQIFPNSAGQFAKFRGSLQQFSTCSNLLQLTDSLSSR